MIQYYINEPYQLDNEVIWNVEIDRTSETDPGLQHGAFIEVHDVKKQRAVNIANAIVGLLQTQSRSYLDETLAD